MRVRFKKQPNIKGIAFKFNVIGEVIIYFDDFDNLGSADSVFISDLEVYLIKNSEWKDMSEAFKNNDLITDNYNKQFIEPKDDEERKRGYRL